MAFNKIPETRRSKTVTKDETGEDTVDSSGFRLPPVQRYPCIARPADTREVAETDRISQADTDPRTVTYALKKRGEEKYTLCQLITTQTEIEEPVVVKHDDVKYHPPKSETKQEKEYSYTYSEMFWSLVAIGSYIIDMGSDVFVAYMYFVSRDWWWFGLTVGFAVASSLTITVVSLTWYKLDQDRPSEVLKTSPAEWICRIVLHVVQLGPVVRYADTIRYGLQSRRAEKSQLLQDRNQWHKEKAFEDTDATLLRLFECYLEAAPQLTLQLYIVMVHGFSETHYFFVGQVVCCASSLISISWALTSYHSALRYSLVDKSNMSNGAIIVMFLWRLCSVTARVLALALFASHFRFWITVVIAFHVTTLFLWILCQQISFCRSRASEVLFGLVVALLNAFDYFNLTEGHTRLRYLFFYFLIFVENLAMMLTFFLCGPSSTPSYLHPCMATILALHLVAIVIQVLYYLHFHPNKSTKGGSNRIRGCIPCSELLHDCCLQPEKHKIEITKSENL